MKQQLHLQEEVSKKGNSQIMVLICAYDYGNWYLLGERSKPSSPQRDFDFLHPEAVLCCPQPPFLAFFFCQKDSPQTLLKKTFQFICSYDNVCHYRSAAFNNLLEIFSPLEKKSPLDKNLLNYNWIPYYLLRATFNTTDLYEF